MTVEELVRECFGVSLERCRYELEAYDAAGVLAHVGLDCRSVAHETAGRIEVGAVRFVCTRPDARRRGAASDLMGHAADFANRMRLEYIVLYSGVGPFYERLGYGPIGFGRTGPAWCLPLGGREWPLGEWHPVGPEW